MNAGDILKLALGLAALIAVLALVALLFSRWGPQQKGPPPPFVAGIQAGRVVIDYDTGWIKSALESSAFLDRMITDPPGYLAVRFSDAGSHLENAELHQLLSWLNDQNIPFSVGKGWGPAEVMEDLRVHGRVRGRFKTIYWTGPGKWHVSDVYPYAA